MPLTNGNNCDFNDISEHNYNRVCNTVSKVGYSDGITDGRESVFQKGFDCGYENGLLTGFELAKYKSFFEVVATNSMPEDICLESTIYRNLNISDAKDKSHFKMLQLPDKTTVEVSQQQENYVNEQKDVFAKALPIVANLLSSISTVTR